MEKIIARINELGKRVLELKIEMNRCHRYSKNWFLARDRFLNCMSELGDLEREREILAKKSKKEVIKKMAKQNSKTRKTGAKKNTSLRRKKGEVLKDHAQSQSTEKLEKVLTNVVNQIAEKEIGKGDEATISPTILKKGKKKATTKKGKGKVKAKSKKQNGQRREERVAKLQAYAKTHGTTIKRMYTKHGKIRPIVIKLKAEGLKESDVYQVANMLGIIKTNTAQKKLKRLGLI